MLAVGHAAKTLAGQALQTHLTHQPCHSLLAHLDVLSVKLATYTLPAVGTTAMGVDRLDAQLQLPILTLSLAGRALHLSVVAAGRYPQDSAHHLHRVVGPLRVNEIESHSLSFAKKAAAFFNGSTRIRVG